MDNEDIFGTDIHFKILITTRHFSTVAQGPRPPEREAHPLL